jgi:hypothetical protein
VRYLDFPEVSHVDERQQKLINKRIAFVATAVLVPSFFTAWYLQRESFFIAQANKYIETEIPSDQYLISNKHITYSFKKPQIKVTILGEKLSGPQIEELKQKAKTYSLSPQDVEILQYSFSEKIEKKFKEGLLTETELNRQKLLIATQREAELNQLKGLQDLSQEITDEMKVFIPQLQKVEIISPSVSQEISDKLSENSSTVQKESPISIRWSKSPSALDMKRATLYLEKRLQRSNLQVENLKKI